MPNPANTPHTTEYRDDFLIDDKTVTVTEVNKQDSDNSTTTTYTCPTSDYAAYITDVVNKSNSRR